MQLIIGLGNPGSKYKNTRHNVGFQTIDELAELFKIELKRTGHTSLFDIGRVGRKKILLAKPLTYMNRSGQAVSSFLRYYQIPPEKLLVIYDDADLELGRLRLRESGSAGGHLGMESIINSLGSKDFPRLRIGIKGEKRRGGLSGYVLKKFKGAEEAVIIQVRKEATRAAESFLLEGITKAMNKYNKINLSA